MGEMYSGAQEKPARERGLSPGGRHSPHPNPGPWGPVQGTPDSLSTRGLGQALVCQQTGVLKGKKSPALQGLAALLA